VVDEIRSISFVILNKHYSGVQIKKNETDRACGMHTRFWWRDLRERDCLEDMGIDWRIILKWIFKKWNWGHGLH